MSDNIPQWAIEAANIIFNQHSNYEALHNPAGLRDLFARTIYDTYLESPAPDASATGLGERVVVALNEYQKYNRLHHDLDAYLYQMGQWAKGEIDDETHKPIERPSPKSFGLE